MFIYKYIIFENKKALGPWVAQHEAQSCRAHRPCWVDSWGYHAGPVQLGTRHYLSRASLAPLAPTS